jgi:DNA-3-methyladenine glycosylase II
LALFDPLLDAVPSAFPAPQAVLAMDDEALRGAGLSWNKIKAIKDLSAKRIEGVVPDLHEIAHLSDDEIVARLVSVRGIGQWSVQMYMMFTLGRPDVWPVDDLGVRKGYQLAYGLEEMPTPKTLMGMGEALRPWRSHAAWYCWREADARRGDAKPEA